MNFGFCLRLAYETVVQVAPTNHHLSGFRLVEPFFLGSAASAVKIILLIDEVDRRSNKLLGKCLHQWPSVVNELCV